jgi:RNA polymerase sigma factor (sigma-70 family)
MSETRDSSVVARDGLFARARSGDQAAWRELFDASYPKVLRAIRRKLNSQAMRSLYDSTDFIGDVWKSLAEKPENFDFSTFDDLQRFLAKAAERKIIDEYRRLHAQKNDIDRHRPLSAWGRSGDGVPEPRSPDPTPSQVAQATEVRENLLSGQTGDDRLVIELKQQNYSNEEIAERTGRSLRTIQRFLKSLGDSWLSRGREGRT